MTKLAAITALCLAARHMVPAWIVPEQWKALTPPPSEVRTVRSADNLLAATRALHVMEAKRYLPANGNTYCNIFMADATQLLGCSIAHRDAAGNERTINQTILDLRAGKYDGWTKVTVSDAANRAQMGLPTVAVWLNPKGHGHVAVLVPRPTAGTVGHVYVTGAGAACREQCTIEGQFGSLTSQVEFFGHD